MPEVAPVGWQARLRYAVAKAGGKHYLIARDAGVAPETLSRLLNDPNQRPALATIEKIAHAVGVCVGWLLEEDDYRLTEADRRQLRAAAELILNLV
jgi:transcriptional regulator with XRE-family HTH domain